MRRVALLLAVGLTVLVLGAGCGERDRSCLITDQEILFEIELVVQGCFNVTHKGWYIDSAGRIYTYDRRPIERQLEFVGPGTYADGQLMPKYTPGRTLVGTVAMDELVYYAALISGLVDTSLSESESPAGAFGLGFWQFIAYTYDQTDASYTGTVLYSRSGGAERCNYSEVAPAITYWLADVASRFELPVPAQRLLIVDDYDGPPGFSTLAGANERGSPYFLPPYGSTDRGSR